MRNKKVSLYTCLFICLISILSTAVVVGSPTMRQVVAYVNYGINIVVDGEVKEMKDVNGNRVYPITFDGSTYVPIRGIGQLVDLGIDWDNETSSVIVDTKTKKCGIIKGTEINTDYSYVLSEEERVLSLSETEIYTFDNGIYCKSLSNEGIQYSDYIGLSIPSTVKNISFTCYSDGVNSINVFNQQGKVLKTFHVNSNILTDFSFDIDSTKNTEIHIVSLAQDENVNNNGVKVFDIYGR